MSADGVWLPVPHPEILGVTDAADVDWLKRRMTPHPLRTWLEPVRYHNGGPAALPKPMCLRPSRSPRLWATRSMVRSRDVAANGLIGRYPVVTT
jgi:hypothetical protein